MDEATKFKIGDRVRQLKNGLEGTVIGVGVGPAQKSSPANAYLLCVPGRGWPPESVCADWYKLTQGSFVKRQGNRWQEGELELIEPSKSPTPDNHIYREGDIVEYLDTENTRDRNTWKGQAIGKRETLTADDAARFNKLMVGAITQLATDKNLYCTNYEKGDFKFVSSITTQPVYKFLVGDTVVLNNRGHQACYTSLDETKEQLSCKSDNADFLTPGQIIDRKHHLIDKRNWYKLNHYGNWISEDGLELKKQEKEVSFKFNVGDNLVCIDNPRVSANHNPTGIISATGPGAYYQGTVIDRIHDGGINFYLFGKDCCWVVEDSLAWASRGSTEKATTANTAKAPVTKTLFERLGEMYSKGAPTRYQVGEHPHKPDPGPNETWYEKIQREVGHDVHFTHGMKFEKDVEDYLKKMQPSSSDIVEIKRNSSKTKFLILNP